MKIPRWASRLVPTIVSVIAGAAALVAQQQQPQAPIFRGGIDLRQLDVTVQDKNRRPVLGLTAADFKVEEDGKVQSIESFSFVSLPDSVSTEPA